MNRSVTIIGEREIGRVASFRLVETRLQHERYDGTMSGELVRATFERGDSAAAVLHDVTNNMVLLVEQFRYAAWKNGMGWILELPAGMVETDDANNPEMTMKHEVLEETGYTVISLKHLTTFYLSPGASTERLFLFYGTIQPLDKVALGGGNAQEGEDIRTFLVPLGAALNKIFSGEIVDAKTIIGLQWLAQHIN
jgi:ADP-ribose diphosphatase